MGVTHIFCHYVFNNNLDVNFNRCYILNDDLIVVDVIPLVVIEPPCYDR